MLPRVHVLVAIFAQLAASQSSSSSSLSSTLLSFISSTIPGIVVTKDGLDVQASVCETFKPNNWLGQLLSAAVGSPYYGNQPCQKDTTGGSGSFKANYTTDPTLPAHTIYAPTTPPPASEKLPVIIWGNGACLGIGTMFQNFLTEVASHGFLVIANGEPIALAITSFQDLLKSIDWVTTNPAAKKYGNIDLDNIAIAGQSCGGSEAYEASYVSKKHKMTVMFNSGTLNQFDTRVSKLNNSIAYFTGGKTDIGFQHATRDYGLLQNNVPALFADADVGHIGTYYQMGGGKIGKAGVAFLKWKLKGDESLKPLFCTPGSELAKDGWNVTSKNGMC